MLADQGEVDLDARMSVAYALNRMAGGMAGDLRGVMLVLAAYDALAGAS